MAEGRRERESRLAQVYGAQGTNAIERTYNDWANDYDCDLANFGYTNFVYAAALLARYCPPGQGEILDAGCGTGALGTFLAVLGYDSLVGIDLSRGMLAKARDTGCYRELATADLGKRLDYPDGHFRACISFGVLTTGHAPPTALDELIRVTKDGGHLIFSVSKPAFENCGFEEKLAELDAGGRWQRRFVSPDYRPMPHSKTEGELRSKAYVYEVA